MSLDDPRTRRGNRGWYRGEHCNFAPRLDSLKEPNAAAKFVIKGWAPDKPFLTKETPLVAFGSCFASNITKYLADKGYAIAAHGRGQAAGALKPRKDTIQFNDGVNNTFALRQVFEHVYQNKIFIEETWHDKEGNPISRKDTFRETALYVFEKAEVFILTLGLSEVWRNKETKEVFWRSVPKDLFDPEVHEFAVSTVAENKDNIQFIYDSIRENNPKAKIIFTVSPVSLVATFRPVSCITANSVSKAVLRAAVDEVYRENDGDNNPNLFYWPSYELVEKFYPNPYRTDGDTRHIKKEVARSIMEEFEKAYSLVCDV